ncbi:MAG: MBL fold metallo-hydrolase, partial [Myxococcota bacterium]
DQSAKLEDGLHVYLCGTGGPMPDPKRGGPCVGILAGDRAFVIDAGSGGVRTLSLMGFPLARVETIYLTHLHSDHIDGLGELLLQVWLTGSRTAPVPVVGPAGTEQVVNGFRTAYLKDSSFRTAHHGTDVAPPSGFGAIPSEVTEDGDALLVDQNGLKIQFTPVTHSPAKPAFAYRFDYSGRSVAISGDTAYDERFVSLAKEADLMLHEALDPEMVETIGAALAKRGQANMSKVMYDILDYHTSPEDAAKAARKAGVGQLVLTHIIPPIRSVVFEAAFLGDAPSIRPDVVIAKDGLRLDLPTSNTDIQKVQLF